MPTVRHTRHPSPIPSNSPKVPAQKSPQSKLSRSRAGSVALSVQSNSSDLTATLAYDDWIGGGCNFEIVAENIQLEGYQIYAVEKWYVIYRHPESAPTQLSHVIYEGLSKDGGQSLSSQYSQGILDTRCAIVCMH